MDGVAQLTAPPWYHERVQTTPAPPPRRHQSIEQIGVDEEEKRKGSASHNVAPGARLRQTPSVMGSTSTEDWLFGWEPWEAPALEDLLPELSREEQIRLQSYLHEHERIQKRWMKEDYVQSSSWHTESERDAVIIPHARYALRHYNTKHPGEEFDIVKPLMGDSVRFKGQVWFHVNFWACCRKNKKIKRFFAEVHYKPPGSRSVCSGVPFPVPGAKKPQSTSSGSCSDLPLQVPEAEKPTTTTTTTSSSSSNSVCSGLPLPLPIPIVEACTIIEEPLGKYRRSCAFCRGHLGILHPMGRKFVCGNDKDRMVQQLVTGGSLGLEMPFTCRLGAASLNSQ
nr:unnamed protein product [Digitaria exilis]